MMKVVTYPSDILKQRSKIVEVITDEERSQLDEMYRIMRDSNGIGLAAPQVGIHKRMVVIQIEDAEPIFMINPKIIGRSDSAVLFNEGCLSLPGAYFDVIRNEQVECRYTNLNNEEVIIKADGILAVCIQHELDHLDGKLFIDRLSKRERAIVLKKYFGNQEGKTCDIQ